MGAILHFLQDVLALPEFIPDYRGELDYPYNTVQFSEKLKLNTINTFYSTPKYVTSVKHTLTLDWFLLFPVSFRLNPTVRSTAWSSCFGGGGIFLALYAVNQVSVHRCLTCRTLKDAKL